MIGSGASRWSAPGIAAPAPGARSSWRIAANGSISSGSPTRTRCASSAPATPSAPTRRPSPMPARCSPRRRPQTLIVCTRDDTHADLIVAALEAGVDVVTEKPMATTAEMCRRILDAERRTGRRVDVGFNYRFSPTARGDQGGDPLRRHRRDRLGRFPLVSRYPARRRLFPPLARLPGAFRQPLRPQGDASFRPAELVPRRPTRRRSSRAARSAITGATGRSAGRAARAATTPTSATTTWTSAAIPGSTCSTRRRRARTAIFATPACSARRSTSPTR